jgi:hypothetical protein
MMLGLSMGRLLPPWQILCIVLLISEGFGVGQTIPAAGGHPDLTGVYQSIPQGVTLPGGLKNSGDPSEVALQPSAIEQLKKVDLNEDAARLCLPVGPFRMMARNKTKIELAAGPGTLVMLFEDLAHGNMRTIHLARTHPAKVASSWMGDSTGTWQGDTFVIDTVGFSERIWLNENGAQHSDAFHLVERIRVLAEGRVLEYRVTAEDPKVLKQPYTYTRIFQKLDTEIMDDFCEVKE